MKANGKGKKGLGNGEVSNLTLARPFSVPCYPSSPIKLCLFQAFPCLSSLPLHMMRMDCINK